jgi:hypothetical protein
MVLAAMDWKGGPPPPEFVGFSLEYREPGGDRFFAVKNRLNFLDPNGKVVRGSVSTLLAPIQMFRWVHFPRSADLAGAFTYKVKPVFMNLQNELSYGEAQEADIELRRETYPGQLNVGFTRGFVSSQAFVDRYESVAPIATLLPPKADDGVTFQPTHPKAEEALAWMGFESRRNLLELLDQAIVDQADVYVVAYDLSERVIIEKLQAIGPRLKILIDDSGSHKPPHSGESQAEALLVASAGRDNIRRQHMGGLQHNKVVVVDGPTVKKAVGGSTNFSWRGFFVQANNAVIVSGEKAIAPFKQAFEAYWSNGNQVAAFAGSPAAEWTDLGLDGIDARVAFSPHNATNALLAEVAKDVRTTRSSLFFSMAFLYQTPGPTRDAFKAVMSREEVFVYGISDKAVEELDPAQASQSRLPKAAGLDLVKPDGAIAPVSPQALKENVPEPFNKEPTGGGGNRMHHKFIVIDFDKPSARVYLGSYNFSKAADLTNGENLLVVRDRKVATAYMVEALRIFDHYRFRVAQMDARKARTVLALKRPPRVAGETPWFDPFYTVPIKARDRLLFA